MAYNGTNPVVIGEGTAKDHYDRLWDNVEALRRQIDNTGTILTGAYQTFRGLHLRTHPNADAAANYVYLDHADEIVLDDGARIAGGWDDLAATIGSAGAGGLDTGSEAASTWYQVYAIRKSSDGTKNLLLHRAKDYFLDESSLSGEDTSFALRLSTAPRNTKIASNFNVDTTGLVEMCDLKLLRVGAVSGTVWLTLEADSGGAPTGTPLATSDKINAALISTSSQMVRFVFRAPATLTASTTYHLVLQGDYTASDTVHIKWAADGSAGTYAKGLKEVFDGTWSGDSDDDMMFRIYVTRNDSAVVMPSGYDQKCLIGYVYNDSGSAFLPFAANGRRVYPLRGHANSGSITAAIPTLLDWSAHIPPGAVAVSLAGNNDTADAAVYAAPVPDGFDKDLFTTTDTGGIHAVGPTATALANVHMGEFVTSHQGIYVAIGSGTGRVYQRAWEW